jgi:hypothetical protein
MLFYTAYLNGILIKLIINITMGKLIAKNIENIKLEEELKELKKDLVSYKIFF